MKQSAFVLLVVVLFFSFLFLFSENARGQDTTPPVISDINVSTSDISATITWTTDEPTTTNIDWGVGVENEFTFYDGALVTSHSATISDLSLSTLYYYQLFSEDGAGNVTISSQSTFTTNATASSSSSSSSSTSSTTSSTSAPKKVDKTPPTFSLDTNLSHPHIKAPTLFGSASDDDSGVDSVEYSVDNGINWTSSDLEGKGTKSTTFSFFLGVIDDGSYDFQIRAKDSKGNTSETKSYTLIIDRLPPQVGTVIFSTGSQTFTPTQDGLLTTVAGLEQKITLSAVGGPISLEVLAGEDKFNLEKNIESGLWSGFVKFDSPGVHDLTIKSVDGAKNETNQTLIRVTVLESGQVSYLGKVVSGAEIRVHVFEPTLGTFIVWDGASYGQSNPQKTSESGKYSLFLPRGKYYIEAKISGVIKLRSQIFELDNPSIINADFNAGVLSVPLITNEVKVTPTKGLPEVASENELIGRDFPFGFAESAKGSRLVSFVASWLPDTAQQIQILETLPDDTKNTIIVPQESEASVTIYRKRGGYNLEMLSDPDGKLVEPLKLRSLPAHFFLDENGKISKVKYGLTSKEGF